MLLEKYKKLVDEYLTTQLDEQEIIKSYVILDGGTTKASEIIYEDIRNIIVEKDKSVSLTRRSIIILKSILIYRYILYDEKPSKYYEILSIIDDATRQIKDFISLENEVKWKDVIKLAVDYTILHPSSFYNIDLAKLREQHPKEYDYSIACQFLQRRSCKINISDSTIEITDGLELFVKNIEELIKEIGGIKVAKYVFSYLHDYNLYNRQFERYFVGRRPTQLPFDSAPQIPFGYLLSLSAKYPYENDTNQQKADNVYAEIIENITHLASYYNVQPYSIFENMFNDGDSFIDFIKNIALYDSLFLFPQIKSTHLESMMIGLFNYLDDQEMSSKLGYTLKQYLNIFRIINSKDENGPQLIDIDNLVKSCNVQRQVVESIFNDISHDINEVNHEFRFVTDQTKNNFWFKPLVKISDKQYLLFDRTWCRSAFIEAFMSSLRENHKKDVDQEIGTSLEIFIKESLKEKNVEFYAGNFNVGSVDGQCDILLPSNDAIILIEIKKKALKRNSRAGTEVELIIDLMDSLVDSQIQTNKVELILRQDGFIELIEGEVSNRIELNNRIVERVSITTFDYGGFQDRIIIKQILEILSSVSLKPENIKYKEKYDKINDKLKILAQNAIDLYKLDPKRNKQYFFDSWFVSVPQFFMILDDTTTSDNLYENIKKIKYVTGRTCDTYFEYSLARKWPKLNK